MDTVREKWLSEYRRLRGKKYFEGSRKGYMLDQPEKKNRKCEGDLTRSSKQPDGEKRFVVFGIKLFDVEPWYPYFIII